MACWEAGVCWLLVAVYFYLTICWVLGIDTKWRLHISLNTWKFNFGEGENFKIYSPRFLALIALCIAYFTPPFASFHTPTSIGTVPDLWHCSFAYCILVLYSLSSLCIWLLLASLRRLFSRILAGFRILWTSSWLFSYLNCFWLHCFLFTFSQSSSQFFCMRTGCSFLGVFFSYLHSQCLLAFLRVNVFFAFPDVGSSSCTVKEELWHWVCGNRVLGTICGQRKQKVICGWRKSHNLERHTF